MKYRRHVISQPKPTRVRAGLGKTMNDENRLDVVSEMSAFAVTYHHAERSVVCEAKLLIQTQTLKSQVGSDVWHSYFNCINA